MPPPPHQPQPTTHQPPQPSSAFLSTVLNPNSNTTSTSSTSPSSSTPPRPARTTAHERPPKVFSTTQRSLQARNKEYNILGRDKGESYETRQRREEAGRILESTEMVIWWSAARGESIPQTRHHFTNILLGIEEDSEHVEWREEWEVAADKSMVPGVGGSPRSAKGKEREREKERGKRRVSSGVGA